MKPYELMVIINPDIGGDATNKRLEEIRKLIAGQKGEIFFEDLWGMRDLAYPIKKHDRGFYAVFNFHGDPRGMKEMDTVLRLDNEVIRHMTISLPDGYEPKTLKAREEEAQQEQAAMDEKKEQKAAATRRPAPVAAKKPVAKKEETPSEAPAAEQPKKAAKKTEEEPTLEEVDAKLRSIIDNPDINF